MNSTPSMHAELERSIAHRGCKLAFKVRGSGPPVVFIQGVGVHGDGWLPQVEELEHRYSCLSYDNRGMGRSLPIGSPITIAQMAEDTLVLMAAQGWRTAHIVGHSLGGLVAQHLALVARDRVRSLALLCTFPTGRGIGMSPRMMWLGLRSRVGTRRMRRNAFLEIVLPPAVRMRDDPDAWARRLQPLFGHDLADQPDVVMTQLAVMREYDARPRLAELSGLPTLVVSAFHDPIAPPEIGRALAEAVTNARYVEIRDASHGATIQHAERINALLIEHFEHAEKHLQPEPA